VVDRAGEFAYTAVQVMTQKGIEIGIGTSPPNKAEGFFLASMEKHDENFVVTKHIMNEGQMDAAMEKMAKAIIKRNKKSMEDIVLIGIRSRGVPLAEWLGAKASKILKRPVDVGSLDINLYRDDLSEVDEQPVVRKTDLPFSVNGKGIVLVDDVLYTGRTIRAAMDALVDFGRPRFVQLAVMVDRGWRELPIQADFIAKKLTTTATENVKVMVEGLDGINQIVLKDRK
jgi:pyrimidine operon attenuation protein/uracil phosphoribosyltransferase